MAELKRLFRVVPLADLITAVAEGQSNLAAVTFDDGYRDCYEHVFPIMKRLSLPFTIFITSGLIERKHSVWSAEYATLPALAWDEIREMHSHGVKIGCHTHEHRRWSSLSTADLRRDLAQSKDTIQNEIGSGVDCFAYPYGQPHDLDARADVLLPEYGFVLSCTTLHTTFKHSPDLMRIPRLSINAQDSMEDFRMQLNGQRDVLALAEQLRSYFLRSRMLPLNISGQSLFW